MIIIASLLFQKPSKESKSKDHLKALICRVELWQFENLLDATAQKMKFSIKDFPLRNPSWKTSFFELCVFQKSFTIPRNLKSVDKEIQKDNVNLTLKPFTNKMQHEIFHPNEEVMLKLKIKHTLAINPEPDLLLPDGAPNVHPIRFESTTAEEVWKIAMATKEYHSPSRLEADCWQKIMNSTSYSENASNVC